VVALVPGPPTKQSPVAHVNDPELANPPVSNPVLTEVQLTEPLEASVVYAASSERLLIAVQSLLDVHVRPASVSESPVGETVHAAASSVALALALNVGEM
jgi:hypothetical protein